jgi:NAD(P)H-hydrate epimerase
MSATLTLSRDQVREVDRRAIEQLGIPGVVLMENAAINAAALIRDSLLRQTRRRACDLTVAIVCGGGNNGGDGYAVARHLHNRGFNVRLYPAKAIEALKGDAATNAHICQQMNLSITALDEAGALDTAAAAWQQADVLVDALLGTGFTGEVREPIGSIIQRINALDNKRIVAIDAPSGLDCETGDAASSTIMASETITFVANKRGFNEPAAKRYTGQVHVADIGVPPGLIQSVAGQAPS